MSRLLACLMWLCAISVSAQDLSGLARIDPETSRAVDARGGGLELDLSLSLGVPYRIFTLDQPARLVMDFREVDWSALNAQRFDQSAHITQLRFGTFRPGWSRMVAQLSGPMGIDSAGMVHSAQSGRATVSVRLNEIAADDFAARSGAPYDPRWDLPPAADVPVLPARTDGAPVRILLDPGHGGIDPGAERGGTDEKTLMLIFARELREALLRAGGFEVYLTRTDDYFVSLERRIALAHQVEADLFLSLHADALAEGGAHGATVYVLSEEASDVASAKLAERHNRGDLLSGVDLSNADDVVTGILLDLARQEPRPRTEALAGALVQGMAQTGGPMNRRPLRSAGFSVLKAADIPSVLIEIGFLSSPRDLENLQNAQWRKQMANGIRSAVQAWHREDQARRSLVRK